MARGPPTVVRFCISAGEAPLAFCEQLRWGHAKRFRQRRDDGDGWIAHASLNARHVGAVEASLMCKLLLGPPLRKAQALQITTQLTADIHRQNGPLM